MSAYCRPFEATRYIEAVTSIMELENSAGSLSVEDIARVESRFDIDFPADYRDFLLRNNGGKPRPSWYPVNDEYEDEISYFLSINAPDRHSDLATQIENYRDWILPTYLPYAVCCGGDVLCISLKDDDPGSVYHWNHGLANHAGEPFEDNMTRLADSLSDFLETVATLENFESRMPPVSTTVESLPLGKPWWKFW